MFLLPPSLTRIAPPPLFRLLGSVQYLKHCNSNSNCGSLAASGARYYTAAAVRHAKPRRRFCAQNVNTVVNQREVCKPNVCSATVLVVASTQCPRASVFAAQPASSTPLSPTVVRNSSEKTAVHLIFDRACVSQQARVYMMFYPRYFFETSYVQ